MSIQAKPKPALFDLSGHPLHLGAKIGAGGEGGVYELRDRSDAVVKAYHKPLDANKSAKIAAMAESGNERLLKLTAWPREPVRKGSGTGPIGGFIMPKITGHQQAFNLYSPKLRLQEFPTAGWQFLIRSAANAARAFRLVHENGHVIGDVNHGNLLIGNTATVRLIDCDSYQIRINGLRWFCEVGTPTHQPPELQNLRTYQGVVRTPNHDNFGLAVIIFQMLFMARHPFSGRPLAAGDIPMEQAISEYRFAYGSNAAAMRIEPPPASLGLDGVTRDVALLFERAFSKQGSQPNGRPRPDEWATALQDLERHLRACGVNPAHQFVDTLGNCPWCEIEAATGVPLFQIVLAASPQAGFTIAAFWAKVNSVPNPGPPPPLPRANGVAVTLSGAVAELQQASLNAKQAADLAAVIQATTHLRSLKKEIETKAAEARRRWQNLQNNWNTHTNSKNFQDLLSALESSRSQYVGLGQKRLRELQKLEASKYQLQLHAHLDRCRISHARIKGLGVAKNAMLQSYGVETAADIVDNRVLAVPGFGPVLLSNLKRWRDQQHRRFIFDHNKGVDQAAKNAVERQILTEKIELERRLIEGLSKLTVSSSHIQTRRRAFLAQAEQTVQDLAKTEADLRATEQVARDLAHVEADLRAAEQAARERSRAEAEPRVSEQAPRDQAGTEPDPGGTPAVQSAHPLPQSSFNARAVGRTILAFGAVSIAALIIVWGLDKGPSGVPPPPTSQHRQPPQIQQQQLPQGPVTPGPPVQPSSSPHLEKDASGGFRPQDGYDWSDGRHVSIWWMPGKISRERPHLIASDTEGEWQPEDGYNWTDAANPKDKSVKWVPGIASDRYPNVVAAPIEGQWRPADGYTWVLNPPRLGDLRVKPAPRQEDQFSTPLPESPFEQGLADRTEWEQWVASLSGDFRQGAEWWASHRSLRNPGSCSGPAATSQNFVFGCEAAKGQLNPSDKKRNSDPQYRSGWNSYTGVDRPPSAPGVQGSPIPQNIKNAPGDSDAESAGRLNAQELKRLRGE